MHVEIKFPVAIQLAIFSSFTGGSINLLRFQLVRGEPLDDDPQIQELSPLWERRLLNEQRGDRYVYPVPPLLAVQWELGIEVRILYASRHWHGTINYIHFECDSVALSSINECRFLPAFDRCRFYGSMRGKNAKFTACGVCIIKGDKLRHKTVLWIFRCFFIKIMYLLW